jgi:hypothetical protein
MSVSECFAAMPTRPTDRDPGIAHHPVDRGGAHGKQSIPYRLQPEVTMPLHGFHK